MSITRARRGPLAAALLATLAGARVQAQDAPGAVLRGVVVTETGDRIPYAVVVLDPGFRQRFADDSGAFAIPRIVPGRYRLMVRQVGYSPFDSVLTIGPALPPIRVQLTHIAVHLAEMTVRSDGECSAPVRPDSSGDVPLATVFEQLRQNADRYWLLAVQYPFRYKIERQLTDQLRTPWHEETRTDTLSLQSNTRWPYAQGRVVTPSEDPVDRGRGLQDVHLPVLADFADTAFQRSHCFTLRGLTQVDGVSLIRLDFRPIRGLRQSDIEGSAFLDPETYQIRSTRVSLTEVNRVASGVEGWTATTTFGEVLPNLLIVRHVSVRTALHVSASSGRLVERREEQELLHLDYFHAPGAGRDSLP